MAAVECHKPPFGLCASAGRHLCRNSALTHAPCTKTRAKSWSALSLSLVLFGLRGITSFINRSAAALTESLLLEALLRLRGSISKNSIYLVAGRPTHDQDTVAAIV